jgi:glycosyltransferase involved in cell wall biosynthesis
MKIFVFGTRGFPGIQGGVEQHCERLYPLISPNAHSITVCRRKPYVIKNGRSFDKIKFINLPSTRIQGFETLIHSFLCTLVCIVKRPDLVHIHNIGPSFFIPFLKLSGLKVILTYHSANYEHLKWSFIARKFLKLSESIALKFADKVIFVSRYQKEKTGRNVKFIQINNGVNILPVIKNDDYLLELGLEKRKYIFSIGRFVEEKGFDLLIRAYSSINDKSNRLVIAGDSDHPTAYSKKIKALAKLHNIVLTGSVSGDKLQQLYSNAKLFVLPSYNEGLPISVLEAMSYFLPVLVSDIQANKEIDLPETSFFRSGNEESLTGMLNLHLIKDFESVAYNMVPYDWESIAMKTVEVYMQVINKNRPVNEVLPVFEDETQNVNVDERTKQESY